MQFEGARGKLSGMEQARTAGWNARQWVLFALVAAAALAGFLIASSRVYGLGFPLDDAWIHQTYARNLALRGEWAFIPGQPSAGSTAPLWSVLLALGYLVRLAPYAWSYLLGGLSLLGMAWAGERFFQVCEPGASPRIPWVGLFLLGEWHLVWAAVSGMETLLMAFLILLVLWQAAQARGRAWGWVGLMIGLSVWVRPDGITLLGPAGLTLLLVEGSWRNRLRGAAWLSLGAAALFVPYLLFNWLVQGSIWPNTFYAKQAEYAVQRQIPLFTRFLNEVKLPLIGSGALLLPGAAAFAWKAWQERRWAALSALVWFLGYALLYALRLPVTYQYGRYFIPAMPVYFVSGVAGTLWLAGRLRTRQSSGGRIPWLLARVWLISAGLVWLAFYGIGATRYAQDVAIIETEMVASARWIEANTPADALVAAHDIGALGYFGQRRILDLAGLVSPEVIPFIRDEKRISGWLDQEGADYLVVLDGWYAYLPQSRQEAWQSEGDYSRKLGGNPMKIYFWKP